MMPTRVTRLLDLVIDRNYVMVVGQRIERPKHLAPSQWLDAWNRMALRIPLFLMRGSDEDGVER